MFVSYSKYYNLFNQDKKYKKEIEMVYKWADSPKTILDIGCGTASYWKYFPEHIFIRGLENSVDMIKASDYKEAIFRLDARYINELDFFEDFDLVTALFDVINYIPSHEWWKNIPVKKGGYFIFDIWDKEKADKEGFSVTEKVLGETKRTITPLNYDGNSVNLEVEVQAPGVEFKEIHKMYLWSHEDIKKLCGNDFEIVEVKKAKKWQTFYKCKRK